MYSTSQCLANFNLSVKIFYDLVDNYEFETENIEKYHAFFKMMNYMSRNKHSILKMILDEFHSFLSEKYIINKDEIQVIDDCSKWSTVDYLEIIVFQFLKFRKCMPRFLSDIKNRNRAGSEENNESTNEYNQYKIMEAFIREFVMHFLDFGLKIRLGLHRPGNKDSSNLL